MKQLLLSIAMFAAFSFAVNAQTTYIDFETHLNPIGYDFGGNGHSFGIDNPNTTGNTSAKVGEITTGPETWAGIAMPVGGTIEFSETELTFTMDIHSDVTGTVLLKLENSANTEQFVEVSAEYTTANAWETLTYEFPAETPAGLYNQLVIFFNFGTTEETTWFFDNVVGPTAAFGSDVNVNLIVDDKLGIANSSVGLKVEGEDVPLTQDGNLWTAQKMLSPYTIVSGGGAYEAIVLVDEDPIDTTTINVAGGAETADWNYLILIEEPEDGTALAISVGDNPPVIDGEIDEVWSNAKVHPLQQRSWFGNPTGLYSYYKVMWDINNVYILNYVDDATFANSAEAPYENDNVELFFDMNQSSGTPFDSDDWQIRGVRGLDTWTGSANVTDTWGANVSRAQQELEGGTGYIMEWAIPWTSLSTSFLPLETVEFNFDVSVADVADGVGRDYIVAWSTNQDINYQNTELYGTITLSGQTQETSVSEMEIPGLSVYPNPVVNQMRIDAASEITSMEIFDMTGRRVIVVSDIRSNSVSFDLENKFESGLHLIKLTDVEGKISSRLVIF